MAIATGTALLASAGIGAAASMSASSKASKTQAAAARDSAEASLLAARETNELNKEIYDQNRADNEPYRTAGTNALTSISSKAPPNVDNWYRNNLGRSADEKGKAYWQNQLNSGRNPDEVYNEFLRGARENKEIIGLTKANSEDASSDPLAKYAATGSTPDVRSWYTNSLGRTGESGGISYWQGRLDRGENPDDVFRDFKQAAQANGENINPSARNWQEASLSQRDLQNLSGFGDTNISDPDSAYANARFSDADSAYANTDIGSKPEDYRSTDFKDADGAYADPKLKNLLADFAISDFQADPGYAYRLEQGNRGVENSAAARGSQLSGATLKALSRFNQDEASNEYGKSFSRFMTQRGAQYDQSAGDFGRAEAQRADKYGQRLTEYNLADAQRKDQYGQRVDKYGRDEGQRVDKYGQRVDEFGRLEDQRKDKYAQRTDLYNRNENQRINRYGIAEDQRARGVADETRTYNRLAEIAGIGQRVNEANAGAGRSYAQQVSANTSNAMQQSNLARLAAGDARASGTIGRANAVTSGMNTAYGLYQQYRQPSINLDHGGGTFDYSSTVRDPIRGEYSY